MQVPHEVFLLSDSVDVFSFTDYGRAVLQTFVPKAFLISSSCIIVTMPTRPSDVDSFLFMTRHALHVHMGWPGLPKVFFTLLIPSLRLA